MFIGFRPLGVVPVCGSFPTSTDQIKGGCGTAEFLDQTGSPQLIGSLNDSNSLFPGRSRIAALGVEITRNHSTGQVKTLRELYKMQAVRGRRRRHPLLRRSKSLNSENGPACPGWLGRSGRRRERNASSRIRRRRIIVANHLNINYESNRSPATETESDR